MTTKTSVACRRKLFALRDRLSHDLADLELEPPLASTTPTCAESDPGDRGDSSVNIYEEFVNLALVKNETDLLREVNDALERFEEGDFGRCESCRERISAARLQAVPYTRCCGRCAAARE